MLENNSFTFPSFANQQSGYYTPTPGGSSTMYHNRAGDLHTPGMGFHLGTPMSMPTSDGQVHAASALDMHAFNPNILSNFQPTNAFVQQPSYAPSTFVHNSSGFDAIDVSNNVTPKRETGIDIDLQREKSFAPFAIHPFTSSIKVPTGSPDKQLVPLVILFSVV